MFDSRVVSSGDLNGGLYRLELNDSISFKSDSVNNLSAFVLLHKRLNHILQDRMKRLLKDGILLSLPDSSRNSIDCAKCKLTKN